MRKNEKAITLIALVITIIVLLILAAISIATLTGENGILNKSKLAKEETNKKEATEILKLKMTDCQMESIGEKGEYPTLAYLAAFLNNDEEIAYVEKQSKPLATLDETPYTNWDKIYTKLEKYPYEFEINGSFQVAVNGEQVTMPSGYMKIPTESLDITQNGTDIDVTNYAKVNVNVPNRIPDNYMKKPTETLNINENNKNYDVTNYANVNVNIPIPKTSDTKTVQFPSTGSSCEFDFGYVPSFIFISSNLKNGYTIWHWSYDSLQTVYGTDTKATKAPIKSNAYSLSGTKITLTPSTSSLSSWHGVTLNIYAIK